MSCDCWGYILSIYTILYKIVSWRGIRMEYADLDEKDYLCGVNCYAVGLRILRGGAPVGRCPFSYLLISDRLLNPRLCLQFWTTRNSLMHISPLCSADFELALLLSWADYNSHAPRSSGLVVKQQPLHSFLPKPESEASRCQKMIFFTQVSDSYTLVESDQCISW